MRGGGAGRFGVASHGRVDVAVSGLSAWEITKEHAYLEGSFRLSFGPSGEKTLH